MRKENWPSILEQKILEDIETPFKWGESDCVLFPAKIAAAILDYDVFKKVEASLFQYDSEEEAAELIREWFAGDMGGIFDMAFERIPVKMAGRGDLVIIRLNEIESCGIIDGSGRRAACKSKNGILFVPLSKAISAWRVE